MNCFKIQHQQVAGAVHFFGKEDVLLNLRLFIQFFTVAPVQLAHSVALAVWYLKNIWMNYIIRIGRCIKRVLFQKGKKIKI